MTFEHAAAALSSDSLWRCEDQDLRAATTEAEIIPPCSTCRATFDCWQLPKNSRLGLKENCVLYDHPYTRLEFDWLACDTEGLIGCFTTAGAGPIPQQTLGDVDALANIFDEVLTLPIVCEATTTGLILNAFDWIAVARRGCLRTIGIGPNEYIDSSPLRWRLSELILFLILA